jgi:hypothetical protein
MFTHVCSHSIAIVLLIYAMECRHIRISCFGTSGSRSMEYEEVEAAAALVILGGKHKWGSSVPGHRMYHRDRNSADKDMMKNYFVERPLYNEDHFRRRFMHYFNLFCCTMQF